MKNKILILLCFVIISTSLFAIPKVNTIVTKGTCIANAKITVIATDTDLDRVRYALIEPSVKIIPAQSENIFENLEAGTYTVAVYDETTGANPVTKTVEVSTSYTGSPLITSARSSVTRCKGGECDENHKSGAIKIMLKNNQGTLPITYSVEGPEIKDITEYNNYTCIIDNLPPGSYKVKVTDACGTTVSYLREVKIEDIEHVLKEIKFSSLEYEFVDEDFRYSTCSEFIFSNRSNKLILKDENGKIIKFGDKDIGYCLEWRIRYPINAETKWSRPRDGILYLKTPFVPGEIKYCFQVKNPCTGDIYNSIEYIYNFPPIKTNILKDGFVFNNLCDLPDKYCLSFGFEKQGYCGPYTIKAVPLDGGDIIEFETSEKLKNSYEIFYIKDFIPGKTYNIKILKGEEVLKTEEHTIPVPTAKNMLKPYFTVYHNVLKNGDYNSASLNVSFPLPEEVSEYWFKQENYNEVKAIYTIKSGLSRQSIEIESKILDEKELWDDIPYTNENTPYIIEAKWCGYTEDFNISPIKKYDGFIFIPDRIETAGSCGLYIFIYYAGYYKDKSSVEGIVNGVTYSYKLYKIPDTEPFMVSKGGFSSKYANFINLESGEYIFEFYHGSGFENKSITVPYTVPAYQEPIINTSLSGGITCSLGTADLTVNASGTDGPFTYRIKEYGENDSKYSPWQNENVFKNNPAGKYTIQVKDKCSIVSQDINIYDGSDQFLKIVGSVGDGKVCEGMPIELTLINVGPLEWRKWYKKKGSDWEILAHETSNVYRIESVNQSHIGEYKVEIFNGSCKLENTIEITGVLPLISKPVIKGSRILCSGSVTLLAETDADPLSLFKWYLNGEKIPGAITNTYLASKEGNYMVEVIPNEGCHSEKSDIHTVYLPLFNECSVFSDKVWFFGREVSGKMTSPGIIFDNFLPTDGSKRSLVNSTGTNFSSSVKTCDGYAFYTSYNYDDNAFYIYNYKHEKIKNGLFSANINSNDAYAGAYIGNNKYALFSVSEQEKLFYHIIDMSSDGGNGELVSSIEISDNITEGIELLPKDNTSDQYWLIYYNKSTNEIKIDLLKGETIENYESLPSPFSGVITAKVPVMVKSPNNKYIACLVEAGWDNNIEIFNFNTLTGQISKLSSAEVLSLGNTYSLAFNQDNNYCVISWGPGKFHVFGIDGSDYGQTIFENAGNIGGSLGKPFKSGGGLKLGPDGIIYHKTDQNVYALKFNGSEIKELYPVITTGDQGNNFSIGLTPPAIDPVSISRYNNAPIAINDEVTAYIGETIIYPLDNDYDPDNDNLFLSNVSYKNLVDATKGSFAVNKDKKQITFKMSDNYIPAENDELVLLYEIRDSVAINSLCSEGEIIIHLSPLRAVDDYALVFACEEAEIDVLQNDITQSNTTLHIVKQGNHGTSSIKGNKIVYKLSGNDCETKTGSDKLTYKICSGINCIEASVIINILKKPEIILRNKCSFNPKMALYLQYNGQYQWEYYSETSESWEEIPFTGTICTENKEGKYRVKLKVKKFGKEAETYTTPKKLKEIKKIKMNNHWWYSLDLE